MRRFAPHIAFVIGAIVLALLLPQFDAPQPKTKVTRDQVRQIADKAAREFGINVDDAWVTMTWEEAPHLALELNKNPELRKSAIHDPVVGPRLSNFRVTYFRKGLEKRPEYGWVLVGENGDVIGVRRRARAETAGAKPTEAQLRPIADAFVRSRRLPGSQQLTYDLSKPTVFNNRVDYVFRYAAPTSFPTGNVGCYIWVHFVGDELAGWEPIEEYKDGSQFRGDFGEGLAGSFIRYVVTFGLLFLLISIFLRKYHAGEVGVSTAALLFIVVLLLSVFSSYLFVKEDSVGMQFGGIDAPTTAMAFAGFKFLFSDIPFALLIFLGWSVGESYARERWGERLASGDAILRRDPINASVGSSILRGLLWAPMVACGALVPAFIAVRQGLARPAVGFITDQTLGTTGGPLTPLLFNLMSSVCVSAVAFLFLLSFFNSKRLLPIGVLLSLVVGTVLMFPWLPVEPAIWKQLFLLGSVALTIVVFFTVDLVGAAVALFSSATLAGFLPFIMSADGHASRYALIIMIVPLAGLLGVALAGLATKREVAYQPDDLAPHVKRIIERERVKAEIDAANRIQAALLPSSSPQIEGAQVASHYRSATEIGGDYFDFLPLPDGKIGLAFGDVAGHGLTSGIVMAMAKSALLVQVGYDASPTRMMEVLNDIVIRTAPRRMLMTFFFGVLDPASQQLQFSSAGHLDPYVYRARTGKLEELSAWGFPLGVKRRDPFRELTVTFEPGDRLVLYSDGLIEAVDDDGHPFGFDRFESVLRESGSKSADEIKKAILSSVKKFTHNRPPEDDQTLVIVSFESVTASRKTA